jgi:uncharacterized protein (DUF1015 family)
MAEIFPFAAWRYNPARVELEKVLTQPYDKISAELQEQYYARSPYNLIPVEKGLVLPGDTPENNVYIRAAERLKAWIAEGILVRDPAPSLYAYFQDYEVPGSGERRTRKGFIALGRIHDYEDGVVFRHELTHSGPKADRLELLRHTRCHTGQLFMLYADPARRVDALLEQIARPEASGAAPVSVRDDFGATHRLWPVSDAQILEAFRREMADKRLVIADGHHRYETALAYRNECRASLLTPQPDAPHERVMMTFVNAHSEGLTILPTHRVLAGLAGFDFAALREKLTANFDWYSYPFAGAEEPATNLAGRRAASLREFRRDLERHGGAGRRALGAYAGPEASGGAFYLFVLRRDADLEALLPGVSPAQRKLDVVLLHRLILERGLGISADAVRNGRFIGYEREMEAALAAVDRGEAQACFLLNAVRPAQVMEMALAGDVLPQKSTDFYPKLLSGLTMYRLDG